MVYAIYTTFSGYSQQKAIELRSSSDYHTPRMGIRNSLMKFQQTKTGRVAFVGGSITYNNGWRDSICNYLKNRFPNN